MYDIPELIRVFEENAVLCFRENQKLLKEFIENNPGEPMPEFYNRDFCINTALAAICKEILHLKEKQFP